MTKKRRERQRERERERERERLTVHDLRFLKLIWPFAASFNVSTSKSCRQSCNFSGESL